MKVALKLACIPLGLVLAVLGLTYPRIFEHPTTFWIVDVAFSLLAGFLMIAGTIKSIAGSIFISLMLAFSFFFINTVIGFLGGCASGFLH